MVMYLSRKTHTSIAARESATLAGLVTAQTEKLCGAAPCCRYLPLSMQPCVKQEAVNVGSR